MEERKAWAPVVTYGLIAVNAVIFLAETIFGGSEKTAVAIAFGALYSPLVMQGQYFRLFTAMFLHFGIEHLAMNMLSLFALGQYTEAYFGHGLYLLFYLLCGLGGNLLTFFSDMHGGRMAVSAGASGAICGMLAVFVILGLRPETRASFPIRRILLAVFLTFYASVADRSISLTAHLGGFLTGFAACLLIDFLRTRFFGRGRLHG